MKGLKKELSLEILARPFVSVSKIFAHFRSPPRIDALGHELSLVMSLDEGRGGFYPLLSISGNLGEMRGAEGIFGGSINDVTWMDNALGLSFECCTAARG